MVTLTEKQAYWKTHREAARSFDGSLVDYARAHDLSAKKLYVYKTQLRKLEEASEVSAGFLKVTTPAAKTSSPVTVSLPNGVRLTVPSLDVADLLEQLADCELTPVAGRDGRVSPPGARGLQETDQRAFGVGFGVDGTGCVQASPLCFHQWSTQSGEGVVLG